MSVSGRRAAVGEFNWQQTVATLDDFAKGEDENTSVDAGANPAEVAFAEIGDDNDTASQFASYRAVQPGGMGGGNPRSGEGKWFSDVDADGSNDTDPATQIRLIKRPLNGDSRTILSRWYTLRDLEEGDVEDRVVLPPVQDRNGNPVAVREGDVLAIEARNPSTSFTISLDNSTLEFPVRVGY